VIDFRYHLVSIIAIFFALAIGIIIGSGPLAGSVDDVVASQVDQLREENQSLRAEAEAARDVETFHVGYGQTTGPAVTTDALRDRAVLMVALPGAPNAQVAQSAAAVTAAGGRVVGTVQIDPTWTDAASDAVLDTLAAQLVASGTTLADGTGYLRGAQLLAGALLEPSPGEPPARRGAPQDGVLTAFEEAGLLAWNGSFDAVADAAVVVSGTPLPEDDQLERRAGAIRDLIGAIDAAGSGSVVAGGPEAALELGAVRLVRDSGPLAREVSTVDVLTVPAGQATAVLALRDQLSGRTGAYGGVGDVDAAMPALTPAQP
jgi:hypothetical protein